jgi:hypothetical protein
MVKVLSGKRSFCKGNALHCKERTGSQVFFEDDSGYVCVENGGTPASLLVRTRIFYIRVLARRLPLLFGYVCYTKGFLSHT